jgi:hypothetical protein
MLGPLDGYKFDEAPDLSLPQNVPVFVPVVVGSMQQLVMLYEGHISVAEYVQQTMGNNVTFNRQQDWEQGLNTHEITEGNIPNRYNIGNISRFAATYDDIQRLFRRELALLDFFKKTKEYILAYVPVSSPEDPPDVLPTYQLFAMIGVDTTQLQQSTSPDRTLTTPSPGRCLTEPSLGPRLVGPSTPRPQDLDEPGSPIELSPWIRGADPDQQPMNPPGFNPTPASNPPPALNLPPGATHAPRRYRKHHGAARKAPVPQGPYLDPVTGLPPLVRRVKKMPAPVKIMKAKSESKASPESASSTPTTADPSPKKTGKGATVVGEKARDVRKRRATAGRARKEF